MGAFLRQHVLRGSLKMAKNTTAWPDFSHRHPRTRLPTSIVAKHPLHSMVCQVLHVPYVKDCRTQAVKLQSSNTQPSSVYTLHIQRTIAFADFPSISKTKKQKSKSGVILPLKFCPLLLFTDQENQFIQTLRNWIWHH